MRPPIPVGRLRLALGDLESAIGNPGFEELGAGVHGSRKIVTDNYN
jgi:hypothetical protein